MGTLTLGERIKALHDYLAQETDDDAEARTALERQLITLQSLPNGARSSVPDGVENQFHDDRLESSFSTVQLAYAAMG